MDSLTFRQAVPDDAPALLAIYAPYVTDTAITYEYEVPSVTEFRRRIEDTLLSYPYIVAEHDGTICGYAYSGPLHEREAYKRSTEISIYLAREKRGGGIGAALYAELERELRERGFTSVYACIAATHRNPDPHLTDASIRFHTRMGFRHAGYMRNCAYKFGMWYDMVYMEKHIARFDAAVPDGTEVFDTYDENRLPTGISVVRGKNVLGDLHLVVHVCVFSRQGDMLIQQRVADKATWAGLWDFTVGGHVATGETSREGAARELHEELGLSLTLPQRASLTVQFDHGFDDYFVCTVRDSLDLSALSLQQSEVQAARWASREYILRMIADGSFIPYKPALVDLLFSLKDSGGAHSTRKS